jgi:hypothetical protein
MVFPLRLIINLSCALAFVACAPANTDSSAPVGVHSDSSGAALAPVEAEPTRIADIPSELRRASDAPEQFEHEGVRLGLDPVACVLIAESKSQRLEHQFEFPGECHFATQSGAGKQDQPRAVATDAGLALIVESSKPAAQDCDTALRVVVLTPAGPQLSRAVQRVAMCAPGGWDEMMFHVLASDPVAFGTPAGDP